MNLFIFMEENRDLFENKLWASKILKKLYHATSSIQDRVEDLTNRIYYSYNGDIDREYIKSFIERIPGDKNLFIKENKKAIFQLHRENISKNINDRLKAYFESEKFLKLKEEVNKIAG